jgi:tetratricopeptide (TPR) repeat protein
MKQRILITAFTFFLASSYSFSQTVESPYSHRIDSLQALLDTHVKQDTLKIIRLHDIARLCFFDMQYKKGFLALREARLISKAHPFKSSEGLYWRSIFVLHQNNPGINIYETLAYLSYEDQGIKEYSKPIQPFPEEQKPVKIIPRLLEATDTLEKLVELDLLGYTYFLLAENYMQLGEMDKALPFITQAENIFTELQHGVPLEV